jgi:hypothetical protein
MSGTVRAGDEDVIASRRAWVTSLYMLRPDQSWG